MKHLKSLIVSLLLITPWVVHSMEPEEKMMTAPETTLEEPSALFKELMKMGGWIGRVAETLPGEIPPQTATRIRQVLAQKVLRNGPPIRKFILSHLVLPFKSCVGHTPWGNSAVFNRTGDKVVLALYNRTAGVWDVETGRPLRTFEHTDHVRSAEFNRTGDKVVTASEDSTARIWDVETGRTLSTLEGHIFGWVRSAAFNRTGDKVVTASDDRTARIWDVETGKTLSILGGHTSSILSAEFNCTGDKVVTASDDETARIWDVETGRVLSILEGHADQVLSAEFNRTGDKVVTASTDRTARIWDVETGRPLSILKDHTDRVKSAVFSRAGDKVVTASDDSTAEIWDVETGRPLSILEGHTSSVLSAVFSRAGDKVVTASGNITTRIWDLGPLLESEKFLTEDITLYQVAILSDIFEVMKARHYLAIHRKEAPERVAHLEGVVLAFDFNRYPLYVWDEYASLPEAIRNLFDPYITKPSSN